jgi:hypothetical protein
MSRTVSFYPESGESSERASVDVSVTRYTSDGRERSSHPSGSSPFQRLTYLPLPPPPRLMQLKSAPQSQLLLMLALALAIRLVSGCNKAAK